MEEEDDGVPRHRDLDNVDDDEEELEEQDTFEQNFNFRCGVVLGGWEEGN